MERALLIGGCWYPLQGYSICVALADFTLAYNATTDKRSAQLLIRLREMYAHFEGLLKDEGAKSKGGGKGKTGRGQKTDQTNHVMT